MHLRSELKEYISVGKDNCSITIKIFPGDGIKHTRLYIPGARSFARFLLARNIAGDIYDTHLKLKQNTLDILFSRPWPFVSEEILDLLKISGLLIDLDRETLNKINLEHRLAQATYSRWLPIKDEANGDINWQFRPGTIAADDIEHVRKILVRQGWKELLFPFAFAGACEMATKRDVFLAMFMGSGKTRLALAVSEYWREVDGITGPTIIIALRRHFDIWQKEISTLPNIRNSHLGDLYQTWFDRKNEFAPHSPFLLISLERLIRLSVSDLNKLKILASNGTVILDESYTISNKDTLRAKVINKIQARHHISCSGTPIRSFVTQLLPILQWTFRGGSLQLPDYPSNNPRSIKLFSDRFLGFAIASDGASKRIPYINNVDLLQELLAPLMYRRTRDEPEVVRDLEPAPLELEWVDVVLNQKHKDLYEALLRQFAEWYKQILIDRGGISPTFSQMLPKINYLLQSIVAPWKITKPLSGMSSWPIYEERTTSAMTHSIEIICRESDEGNICVVFGHTVEPLKIICNHLIKLGYPAMIIHGEIDIMERNRIVEKFKRGEFSVLIGTYGVMAESVSLNPANRIILTEATWVPSVISQAIARITRGIQENSPKAYFVRSKGTIQDYQLTWCALKQHSIDSAIDLTKQYKLEDQILDIDVYISLLVENILEAKQLERTYHIT